MKTFSLLLLTLCGGGLASAGLIWKVPDDPLVPGANGVPKYFSGTNSRVFISASSAPQPNPIPGEPDLMEPTIKKHELWINGVKVGSWEKPPFRPLSFSASYAYMIDSGAFCAPGDDFITVTLKVWEVGDTSPQVGSYTVPVKNRALSVNRYE